MCLGVGEPWNNRQPPTRKDPVWNRCVIINTHIYTPERRPEKKEASTMAMVACALRDPCVVFGTG